MKCLQSCRARSGLLVYSSPAILPPGLQRRLRATVCGAGNCLSRPLSSPARVLARAFHQSTLLLHQVHSRIVPYGRFGYGHCHPVVELECGGHLYQPFPCHLVISYMTVIPLRVYSHTRQVHEQRHRVSLQVELCPFIVHHV